jgi:hypothetical protein
MQRELIVIAADAEVYETAASHGRGVVMPVAICSGSFSVKSGGKNADNRYALIKSMECKVWRKCSNFNAQLGAIRSRIDTGIRYR